MLTLDLKIESSKAYFFSRTNWLLEGRFSLGENKLLLLQTSFLERFFTACPELLANSRFRPETKLKKQRGRAAETFNESNPGLAKELRTNKQEELFFASGELLPTEEDTEAEPFYLRLASEFETFENGATPIYKVKASASAPLQEILSELNGRLFSRLIPLQIKQLRLALEEYRPTAFGSMLGLVPLIKDSLILELNDRSIYLKCFAQGERSKTALPFSSLKLLEAFSQALQESGLYPNFLKTLEERA